MRQKVAERAEAIARQRETVYLIEGNVREGRGGLRDIHLAEWLAAVAFPSTRGDVWRQLQRLGVVSRRDVSQIQAARDFLLLIRNWMHFEARRPADILVRERQEKLAGGTRLHRWRAGVGGRAVNGRLLPPRGKRGPDQRVRGGAGAGRAAEPHGRIRLRRTRTCAPPIRG